MICGLILYCGNVESEAHETIRLLHEDKGRADIETFPQILLEFFVHCSLNYLLALDLCP